MKKSSKSPKKATRSRAVTYSATTAHQAPTKSMMLIVSLIGGGIAWLLSGNMPLGLTVFAAIGIGNWLVYHRGISI